MRKTIFFLGLMLLVATSWTACKDTAAVQEETVTETGMDSIFLAKRADAVHNMNAYAQAIYLKIQELENELTSASDATKAGITAELEKCKNIQSRVEDVRRSVSAATPEVWEKVKGDFDDIHYDVRMAISKTPVSKENANKISN